MKISMEKLELSEVDLEMILKVNATTKEITDTRYGVHDKVMNEIIERVTTIFINKHADEIVNKIDMENLIKRIQLNVVNSILQSRS